MMMKRKTFVRSFAAIAATGLVPFAARAQFGGMLGGGKGGGVSPDAVEKHMRDYFAGINRMNRLLGEALKLNELAQSAQEKAECTQSGSCGLKDGASLAKGHSDEITKKVKERQAAGEKMTEEEGVKAMRSWEGFGKAVLSAKNAITDGKNMDKGMKALAILPVLPDIPQSIIAAFNSAKALIDYMRFSGIKSDDLVKSLTSASSELSSVVPGLPTDFGKS
jgi:hypothetical protein